MKLELTNIGGISNQKVELKEGLNVIRAPNATGKTSFTHGLRLASQKASNLKDMPQILKDGEKKGTVTIEGQSRSVRPLQTNSMGCTEEISIIGEPIINCNGKGDLIFAEPGNEFLDAVTKGKSIEKFLDKFSDAEKYKELKTAVKHEEDLLNIKLRQHVMVPKELKDNEKEITVVEKEMQVTDKKREKAQQEVTAIGIEKKVKQSAELTKAETQYEKTRLSNQDLERTLKSNKGDIPKLNEEVKYLKEDLVIWAKQHPNPKKELEIFGDQIQETQKLLKTTRGESYGIEKQKNALESSSSAAQDNCLECGAKFSPKQRMERASKLREKFNQLRDEMTKLQRKQEDLETERDKLKQERLLKTGQSQTNINNLDSKISNLEAENIELERDIEGNKEANKKTRVLMDKLTETLSESDKQKKTILEKLREQYGILEGRLIFAKKKVGELTETNKELVVLTKKTGFLGKVKLEIDKEVLRLETAVADKFNKRIAEVYSKLGFKDFNIEISFGDIIVKRKGSYQPLNRLSQSERVTIGVIVMLAGKEEFLPDFPFFVLDEVTTAYDSKRFKVIMDYIQEKVDYTVVTAFAPEGNKILVEDKLK